MAIDPVTSKYPVSPFERCNAQAIDRGMGITVYCILKFGHKDPHFWEHREGDQLLSAAWYGPDNGLPTYIGTADD